ncbi:MAG: AAA family ATPase [Nitrospirales bacterium]|nr:AAA family ATPase [Nitrospirales bacterium]
MVAGSKPTGLMCLTREHGLVVFDLKEYDAEIENRQNDIYAAIHRKLLGYKTLRSGRDLALKIQIVTFTPGHESERSRDEDVVVAYPSTLIQMLEEFPPISIDIFRSLNAAIERVTTIKPPRKRFSVTKADSMGAKLKEIEKQIANLDHWQKRAAIESPDGPQRIRGLAGSGKTIVLALKAAMLHAMNPQWRIVLTFNTRSLYQQFKELVRRFTFENINDEPDWEKLQIIHAWGSARQPGIYSEIAKATEFDPRDFGYAKSKYGHGEAFKGVCAELLENIKKRKTSTYLFDAVLIDEAQDLPQPFFELVYSATKDPKRIVWAYDELQNLGSYSMLPPQELFGTNSQGEPNVMSLENEIGRASQDLVLPVCYRNTPWALTVAHALGLGIYRQEGLVQYFEDQGLWEEIGYETVQGKAEAGHHVVLKRKPESTPTYFADLLKPDDAVVVKRFETIEDQMSWVTKSIANNLTEDELEIDDILVVIPEPRSVGLDAAKLIPLLEKNNISSHIVGITTSLDMVFDSESLAITGIFRAKGNEAPMVYILNSEFCAEGSELSRLRNIYLRPLPALEHG